MYYRGVLEVLHRVLSDNFVTSLLRPSFVYNEISPWIVDEFRDEAYPIDSDEYTVDHHHNANNRDFLFRRHTYTQQRALTCSIARV